MKQSMQVKIGDKSHTIEEWAEITGISVITLRYRYSKGATAEEFLKPVRKGDKQ